MTYIFIIYIVCLVVWLASIARVFAYKRLGTEMERTRTTTPPDGEVPGISVIITTHNQEEELRKNLPLILRQIYPDFEVIVVDIKSTDNTKMLLERLEEDNLQLHHTFTPSTGRDISTERLAITLGIKAATKPWIVITKADCSPVSHQWLRRMGEAIAGHRSAEMVIGYSRYNAVKGYSGRRLNFFRTWLQMLTLTFVRRGGAYRCDGTNMAYKKELFLSHQGFASHSNLLVGATDIMVNQNSTKHNCTVCLHPEAVIEQNMSRNSRNLWHNERLFFQETRRHFTKKWIYRARYAGSVLLHAMLVMCLVATIGVSIWQEQYIATGAAVVLWFIHLLTQGVVINRTVKMLNGHGIGIFHTAWFIHLIPFWDMGAWLRHSFTSKKRFRKKYI